MKSQRALDRVYFYTSNIEKYLQARLVFERHGLTVDYFKSVTDPYDEEYSGTTAELLIRAIEQVTSQIGRGRLVFVEDTSLRIEALSSSSDFPGMKVKHWFQDTTFEELDLAIKDAGGDRRATVKSDIALKLPGLDRPLLFHGETTGRVAPSPPTFSTDPQHPWLTPNTFNGWFIADGCDRPLGALNLEDSLAHDFRVRAFEELINRLEEFAAALNLPPTAFRRTREHARPAPSLFDVNGETPHALLVVGRTCAGKTTAAQHAQDEHGVLYVEASEVVKSLDVKRLPTDDAEGFTFAMRALEELGHDIVPREIVKRHRAELDGPFVISGLRDIEEIRFMLETVPRSRVLLVEASERTRFERHVRRGRVGAETALSDFRARDRRQNEFGLLPVVEDLADCRILNEGTIEAYLHQVDAVLVGRGERGVNLSSRPRHRPEHHQLFRCLRILEESGRPLRCDEIEELSIRHGEVAIRHNNANKVLKAVTPALVQRLDPPIPAKADRDSARVRYAVTSRGVAYLRLLESRWARIGAGRPNG